MHCLFGLHLLVVVNRLIVQRTEHWSNEFYCPCHSSVLGSGEDKTLVPFTAKGNLTCMSTASHTQNINKQSPGLNDAHKLSQIRQRNLNNALNYSQSLFINICAINATNHWWECCRDVCAVLVLWILSLDQINSPLCQVRPIIEMSSTPRSWFDLGLSKQEGLFLLWYFYHLPVLWWTSPTLDRTLSSESHVIL